MAQEATYTPDYDGQAADGMSCARKYGLFVVTIEHDERFFPGRTSTWS